MTLPAIAPQQIIAQNVAPDISGAEHDQQLSAGLCVLQQSGQRASGEVSDVFGRSSDGCGGAGFARPAGSDRNATYRLMSTPSRKCWTTAGAIGETACSFDGEYEVTFGGVKHGGRNFLQIAKVSFVLEISAD